VAPGAIVRYRGREWIVLPSENAEVARLRPIGGTDREECGVHQGLATLLAGSLPYERIEPAQFPAPDPVSVQDHDAVKLLLQSARLLLREGAAPFRALGRVSFQPRPYQFVPLLMALRLNPVRLLIADDVGVGKTIEAILIARELLARGEIQRVAVLCPPHLCGQWQQELQTKTHLNAPVVRSGTVPRLERGLPPDTSLFEHHRHFVASIDLVKGDRYRSSFLRHCPDFVVVDEVHGAAEPLGGRGGHAQQQRHELLKEVAAKRDRHLVLLTATPHSGVETAFLSILGLLDPEYRRLDFDTLAEPQRRELARHFVQRSRPDVAEWLGTHTHFPKRRSSELTYTFSPAYRELYQKTYAFARELVRSAETLSGWGQRMRFWSALALLRAIGSSPAAAETALRERAARLSEPPPEGADPGEEEITQAAVFDRLQEGSEGETLPGAFVASDERDRALLNSLARLAEVVRGAPDTKLQAVTREVDKLLADGFHPIVWCRFIATAHYVADALRSSLEDKHRGLKVSAVTGELADDERSLMVEELGRSRRRVLVATDCLSEGINLQDQFTAVIHYDLPWNPNRLEQREGRVDRFGQQATEVRAVLVYGADNPVDGAVLEVLLRKAWEIHKRLGIYVPVPANSESVLEAVMQSLFFRAKPIEQQLGLFAGDTEGQNRLAGFHQSWDGTADRERKSRTRFAQHTIKPDEVARELERTDRVLGSPEDLVRFLQAACGRLGVALRKASQDVWELDPRGLPDSVRSRLGDLPDPWRIAFSSPPPRETAYVGRNHPLIEGLAEHLLDLALYPADGLPPAARCGVIRTGQVERRTTLLVLRLRYFQKSRGEAPVLAEETLTWGFAGLPPDLAPLDPDGAAKLLDALKPEENVSAEEKRRVLDETLGWQDALAPHLAAAARRRAEELEEMNQRLREQVTGLPVRVEPHLPPDLLGILVVLPRPQGVAR
jgi:superfamily II DNA or RNA helicase